MIIDPIEWDCEGCAVHVVAFGLSRVPAHQFCAPCAWLCEFVDVHGDPDEFDDLYRTLYPIRERDLRKRD